MDHSTHNKIVSFIWSIADDCLRDVFVRGKYRDVILPMFVLRRLDALLEPTKDAVAEEQRFQIEEAGFTELEPDGLCEASGYVFYNTSEFTLQKLVNNPSQLEANFKAYLDGFSDNVKEIIKHFDLRNQIHKMAVADVLHNVLEKFVSPEINLSPFEVKDADGRISQPLTNLGMGYVFEELIRKFNEDNNEEAGEHFTPREVIDLMTHILFEPVKDNLPPVIFIYDPACGSGGMLTEAQNFIIDPEGNIKATKAKTDVYLHGKEINGETYAICKSDMMIKGNDPENIRFGSTLATDEFSSTRFDFMLSNPPYGKSWKTEQKRITDNNDPRFKVKLKAFNKGNHHGKGNPVNEHGYRTAYLWEAVLMRRSLTNIIEHFAKLVEDKNPKTGKTTKTLYFPRYQQLDVVLKLLKHVKENGSGQRYLIQHSAGSGKSNTIAWLAYQLIELYNLSGKENIFDSVIVVTDRRILDAQLKKNISLFSEVKNIVAHAAISQDLKTSLTHGKKLIITTLHKFPFILDGLKDLSERQFAVIIDEAHSSQDKSTGLAGAMTSAFGANGADEEPEDIQDKIIAEIEARRMGKNVSFFAFTATPKNTTLEKFGIKAVDGSFHPFHLYSMKQAIEEGFILDVLSNYSTYRSYYELQKSIEDNPLFNTKKAQKKLKEYVEGHAETIEVKADIMVKHFIEQVWQAKKLKGQAKVMVVTRNIECAIRYFFAIRKALEKNHSPCKAIVAFSGESKSIDGIKHTEHNLNGFSGDDIAEEFDSEHYQFLVVANKFLTGFDQPKLHTMYVDKKLQGVLAVQTLSRLNRCNDKLGKKDTFVLDFYNSVEEIKKAFDPFYTATSLSQATDVNVLHDLKEKLDEVGIYEQSEVVAFNELFFNEAEDEALAPLLDQAVARFDTELNDDQRIDFKIKAKQFVKIYAQVAALISFNNLDWEMLHWFLKFLIPKLKVKDPEADALDNLLNSVDLSTYGLERVKLHTQIELDADDSEIEPLNPNPRGKPDDGEEKDLLQAIINSFNERFFKGWDATPQEQRIKFINIANHVIQNPDYQLKVVDNPDSQNSQLALQKLIEQAIRIERKRELDLYQHYSKDEEFKQAFDSAIIRLLAQPNSNELKQMLMVKI